ncbi:MAG TPA: hypothetical protein VHD56_13240, partial [Tepidisphaeraceae bacterium]|nr:hypothetical protein [Tepidisphaeraceae bacterium]
ITSFALGNNANVKPLFEKNISDNVKLVISITNIEPEAASQPNAPSIRNGIKIHPAHSEGQRN